MRRLGLTWVLLLVWLALHGQSPALSSLDTLMQSRPDSALAVLVEGYETFGTSVADRHYYHLLLSEALYKNDQPQTDREALLDAMAYYDSLCEGKATRRNASIPYLAARCHYMNGVGYYEMDSVVLACTEYFKALELMEEHYSERKLVGEKAKFMALAYTHLMALFSDQYLHEQVVYLGKKSLVYYDRYDAEVWHKPWILDKIGSHYHMMEQLDSAAFYYEKAMEMLPDTSILTYRDIATVKAMLSYDMGEDPKLVFNRLHFLLEQSESEKEFISRCLSIGDLYYQEKEWDSAQLYFSRVYDAPLSTLSKKEAAQKLRDIYLIKGDTARTHEYNQYLSQESNTGVVQATANSQLTELLFVFEQNKKDIQHQQRLSKQRAWLGILLFSVTVIAVVWGLLYFLNKCRLQKKQNELSDASQQLKELMAMQKLDNKEMASDFNAFINSPVCFQILQIVQENNFKPKIPYLVYKSCALDRKQKMALSESADLYLSGFTKRLRKEYPKLTYEDVKYCCLYLLGLNEADISALMQRAYSTVCDRNRKIKRIMGVDDDLYLALRSFV